MIGHNIIDHYDKQEFNLIWAMLKNFSKKNFTSRISKVIEYIICYYNREN